MNSSSFDKYLEKEIKKDPSLRERLDIISNAIDWAYKIYEARKRKGLTQKQFAKIVGTSQPNISRIEKADYRNYTIDTLDKVAQALDTNFNISVPLRTITWVIFPDELYEVSSATFKNIELNPSRSEDFTFEKKLKEPDRNFIFSAL